jgi:hypothetical protein
MHKAIILLFSFISVFYQCKNQKTNTTAEKDTKTCLQAAITVFAKSNCKSGLSVKEYVFQSKTVYVFDQSPCGADMTSEVLDAECKSLGYLGGLVGNTEIAGEDFSQAAYVKTVWEN